MGQGCRRSGSKASALPKSTGWPPGPATACWAPAGASSCRRWTRPSRTISDLRPSINHRRPALNQNARIDDAEHPPICLSWIDPGECVASEFVIETALGRMLEDEGLEPWPKPTGDKGLHLMRDSIQRSTTMRRELTPNRSRSASPQAYPTATRSPLRRESAPGASLSTICGMAAPEVPGRPGQGSRLRRR